MNIANSTSVDAAARQASNSTPGTVANAAGLLVLRKALDAQSSTAAALLSALPQAPASAPASAPGLGTDGNLGRHLDIYA